MTSQDSDSNTGVHIRLGLSSQRDTWYRMGKLFLLSILLSSKILPSTLLELMCLVGKTSQQGTLLVTIEADSNIHSDILSLQLASRT